MSALALAFALSAASVRAADIAGKVVGVHDGDTLTLLAPGNQQLRIRLTEIDAPESGQPGGQGAKAVLSGLIFGKEIRVSELGHGQYGRTLGRVFVGKVDANAAMVRTGWAWAYRQYLTDKSLLSMEDQAKREKRGLWALPASQQISPWDWRKGKRAFPAPSATKDSTGQQCGAKRYCGEMTSCTEARHFLEACGVRSLDGDGDGIPCEAVWHENAPARG